MKSSASESVRNACFNLTVQQFFSPGSAGNFRFWSDFRTALIQTPNAEFT